MASQNHHASRTHPRAPDKTFLTRPYADPQRLRPTCLFLAAKTTNYPVPINDFTPKFAKLSQTDVLDTEFTVAQSLGFAFWIRGAEKAVRGWTLEFQVGLRPLRFSDGRSSRLWEDPSIEYKRPLRQH